VISLESSGSFRNIQQFLLRMQNGEVYAALDSYAQQGVAALSAATPVDSGETARAWSYEISHRGGSWSIEWTNGHVNDGEVIAILLQYGHGTGTGGFVQGRDYINPAMRPIFDRISADVWKAVSSL
jgi:hypothetical protein